MKGYLPSTALLISLFLLSGCKPAQVVGGSTERVHDSDHTVRQTDSLTVYVHDSIFMYVAGDTVRIDRWHTRYRDRWHERTDTLIVRDSIAKETPVMVYKTMSGWQTFQLWCGRILLVIVAGGLLFKIFKRHLKPF